MQTSTLTKKKVNDTLEFISKVQGLNDVKYIIKYDLKYCENVLTVLTEGVTFIKDRSISEKDLINQVEENHFGRVELVY